MDKVKDQKLIDESKTGNQESKPTVRIQGNLPDQQEKQPISPYDISGYIIGP